MILTADVSMYPNRESFIPPIDRFIERINQFPELTIKTFPTSTVVQGDAARVHQAIQQVMTECFEEFGMAVYVVKFIPGYEAL